MKKFSVILIIAGLLIASYPLINQVYTLYLESKLIIDWDVDLDDDESADEASQDYFLLQDIFDDELVNATSNEQGDSDYNNNGDTVDVIVETDLVDNNSQSEATPTPAATKKPALKAIGTIKIDKIDAKIPILDGATKTNLRVGAGQITGTTKLGEVGNAALAAHRSHTYGRMFNRLDEIEVGDKIQVETKDGTFEYTVYKKLVVEPTDLTVLNRNNKDKVLTLITCTPLYTATHRLIVHAVMKDENNN